MVELRIMAFKGSRLRLSNTHEAILEVRGKKADADAMLGAHLVWRTQTGRVVRGKVVGRHGHKSGNKVVARFHKGLPGQALGTRVEVRKAEARGATPAAGTGSSGARSATKAATRPAAKPAAASKPAGGNAQGTTAAAKEAPPVAAPGSGASGAAAPTGQGLTITKVQFDAPGPEATKLTREWVEVSNFSGQPADLTGHKLKDRAGHVFAFPQGFTLAPGGVVRVRTGKGDSGNEDLYWGRGAAVWNNEDDTAWLLDAKGQTLHRHRWSLITSKPGDPTPPPLRIAAVQFDAPGPEATKLTREWVRITNETSASVALEGWKLSDKAGHTYTFPKGAAIAPGAAVQVRTGIGEDTVSDLFWGRKAAVWNNDGDKAELVDAQGARVATFTWSPEGTWATYRLP